MLEGSVQSYLSNYSGLLAMELELKIKIKMLAVVLPTPAIYPCITYQKISAEENLVMGGKDSGILECRMQFDCWGSTYPSAKSVATQVKKAFKNYIGEMYGTTIHCTQLVNEKDTYGGNVFRTMLEIEFQYEE